MGLTSTPRSMSITHYYFCFVLPLLLLMTFDPWRHSSWLLNSREREREREGYLKCTYVKWHHEWCDVAETWSGWKQRKSSCHFWSHAVGMKDYCFDKTRLAIACCWHHEAHQRFITILLGQLLRSGSAALCHSLSFLGISVWYKLFLENIWRRTVIQKPTNK